MSLKLSELFKIIYPNNLDSKSIEKLKKKIDNLKIDNLLNLNKKKLSKYFLVVNNDRNIIDFRIDPNFELINLDTEVQNIETNDYHIINEGLEYYSYDNFHTNININVIQNKVVNNQISIKKVLHSLNYPDNLSDDILYDDNSLENDDADSLENDDTNSLENVDVDSLENNLKNDISLENDDYSLENNDADSLENNDDDSLENDADLLENDDDSLKNNGDDALENNDDDKENNDNDKYDEIIFTIKRKTHLDSFGFNILNDNNKIFIVEVKKDSNCYGNLLIGDIVKKINNKNITKMSIKNIIKIISSKLSLKLKILREKNKVFNFSNESIYRIIGQKYIKLYLFKKKFNVDKNKYDNKDITLITSIFLSDYIPYPSVLDTDENQIKNYLINNDIFSKNYYDRFYIDYGEIDYIQTILESNIISSNDFFKTLSKIKSGMYLNTNNILWNIYLSCCILSDFEDTLQHNYLKYSLKNIKQLYFPYYKKNKASIYEKLLIKSMIISCDKCYTYISKNITSKIYGSPYFGDLCEKCYNNKKIEFKNKLNYLKRFMLLQGRKKVFKNQLKKTKIILDNLNIKKIKKQNYINLLENINKTIMIKNDRKICKICYDILDMDGLGVYNKCGHVFHYNCIEKISTKICPSCREESDYCKLFI